MGEAFLIPGVSRRDVDGIETGCQSRTFSQNAFSSFKKSLTCLWGDRMIRLRPYKESDAERILSWCKDERTFYQWTAGILGAYPISVEQFTQLGSLMRFTALDDKEIVGFFTARNPKPTLDELRFGFVIINPEKRGRGFGKEMLRLGLEYARIVYKAKKVSLGVFENNERAYRCYKAAGFQDVALPETEQYRIMGEVWACRELEYLL